MGRSARPARDALERALGSDPIHDVRYEAVKALGMLCDPETLPALRAVIFAWDGSLARHAVEAIGRLGPRAASVRSALAEQASGRDGPTGTAQQALRAIDGERPAECDEERSQPP